jgi:hypothetical protein
MTAQLLLHVIHVSGTRMIHQGTDGLSRGQLTEGVFSNNPLGWVVPLHLIAFDSSPSLLPWLCSWLPLPFVKPLTLNDWFVKGHGIGPLELNVDGIPFPSSDPDSWYLWAPPPAAAQSAVDELATSCHK